MIRVFIGFDVRETAAFNVLAHSINARASAPVSIAPVTLSQLGAAFHQERNPLQSTDFNFKISRSIPVRIRGSGDLHG
jgi:hypothetical protein